MTTVEVMNGALFPGVKKAGLRVQVKRISSAFVSRYQNGHFELNDLYTLNMPGTAAEHGQCGAHALRVLKWLSSGDVISAIEVRNQLVQAFAAYSSHGALYQQLAHLYQELVTAQPDRWLDNIEITAAVVKQQYGDINVCVITEKIQKVGTRRLKFFRGELLHYDVGHMKWVFLQLTNGFAHYEIVAKQANKVVDPYFECADALTQYLLQKLEISPQNTTVDSLVEQVQRYADVGMQTLIERMVEQEEDEEEDIERSSRIDSTKKRNTKNSNGGRK
jgi:hypothetical protein